MEVIMTAVKSYETPNSENGNACIVKLRYQIKRKVKYELNGESVEDVELANVYFHKGFKRMIPEGAELKIPLDKYNSREVEESYEDPESGETKVSRKVWLVVKE